jgi:sec-independent protein translocase protein TatA
MAGEAALLRAGLDAGGKMFANALSPLDWIVVLLIALLIFGPGKLADIGKGMGEGIKNFKHGMKGDPPPESTPPEKK